MVVAICALVISLVGTGYAASKLTGKDIENGSLSGKDVRDSSLTGKDVKDRTLSGKDVRDRSLKGVDVAKDSLGSTEVDEASLAQVPAAIQAQNAGKLGGSSPNEFVTRQRYFQGWVTAARGTNKAVVTRGPFTITLTCLAAAPNTASARLDLVAGVPTRSTFTGTTPETSAGGSDTPASTPINSYSTGYVGPDSSAMRTVGGYMDASNGRSVDVSARLRVNRLGVSGCSAVVTAVFNGV